MKKLKLIYNNKYSINNLNNESFIAKFVSINTRINKNYLISILDAHLVHYPSPINLSYAWRFGSLAGMCLVIQI